jgi:hypothetical protein
MMRACLGLLALFFMLALVLGTDQLTAAARAFQDEVQMSGMVVNTSSSDVPTSGTCDKCLWKDQATHACFAVCAVVQAVLPQVTFFMVSTGIRLSPAPDRQVDGTGIAPAIPPPRTNLPT